VNHWSIAWSEPMREMVVMGAKYLWAILSLPVTPNLYRLSTLHTVCMKKEQTYRCTPLSKKQC